MFMSLVNYVRTHMNLVDFQVYGRYVIETFDDGAGNEVRLEVFDHDPQVVRRPRLEPVYRPEEEGA